ncbi:MAG: chemotaxis protein CheW [Wolinella sp.]
MSRLKQCVEKRAKTHLYNIMQLAIFTLGDGRYYGINVSKILSFEDIRRYKLLRCSEASDYLMGFVEYQGRAIPVLGLREWLGLPQNEKKERIYLVCEYNKQSLAFPILEIENIHNVPTDSLQKCGIEAGGAFTYSAIVEIFGRKESVLVLDIERLLEECALLQEQDAEYPPLVCDKELWVAEDSMSARELLRMFLDSLKIKARFFGDGLELIETLKKEGNSGIGAILTDLEMPRADGYQVLLYLRGEHSLEKLPVWVYSSMSNQGVLDKVKSLGAEGLIAKGDYEALYKALKECLQRD